MQIVWLIFTINFVIFTLDSFFPLKCLQYFCYLSMIDIHVTSLLFYVVLGEILFLQWSFKNYRIRMPVSRVNPLYLLHDGIPIITRRNRTRLNRKCRKAYFNISIKDTRRGQSNSFVNAFYFISSVEFGLLLVNCEWVAQPFSTEWQ